MTTHRLDQENRVTILTIGKPDGKELTLKTGPSYDSYDYHHSTIGKAIAIHQLSTQQTLEAGFLSVELLDYDETNRALETIAPLLFLPVKAGSEPRIIALLNDIETSKSITPKKAAKAQEILRTLFHEVSEIIAPAILIPFPDR
jgi:hypothetical protein